MEPDITLISSAPVTDANGRPVVDEHAHAGVSGIGFTPGVLPAAPLRTNGHGHSHDHAPLLIESLAPAAPPWRAMAGPARTTLVAGGYASAPVVTAPAPGGDLYQRFGKRLLDVTGATLAIIVSAPLVLLAALAIMIETRGSVFYRSTRVGRGGKPFTFYKLRSMVSGADRHRHHLSHLNECDGPVFKISRDPRVTVVGRFLRTTSLDELPQLWNVLRGDMSLVGPRPPLPDEVSHYQPWQMRRLDVRPGLTCLWQISGRSRIGFEEWMRLDLEYINRRSFRLDFQILLRTIPAVLSREGAY